MMNMLHALAAFYLPLVTALVGYDCSGEGFNITTISLLDVGKCNLENVEPKKEQVYVQLMQLADYDKTTAIQCKIEVDRTIHYCGMSSHVSVVHNGKREYLQEIGEGACKKLHNTGTVTIANAVIDRVKKNTTNRHSATLAGSVGTDGRCNGAQYTDGYGAWDGVVVQATIKITLQVIEIAIKRATGQVILPTGTQCPLAPGYCLDAEGAETYWTPLPVDSCHFDQYNILYEGLATKLTPEGNQTTPTIYTVTSQDTTFALTRLSDIDVCGYKLTQTEHPKLFIMETEKGRTFNTRSRISINNLDIFLYVNSKFVYVEKHIRTQLTQLYKDMMEQKCALEQQVLQNALTLASIAPDEMAYRIMREPGYTAVTTGEVIHLVKCVPVECKVRQTEQCFNELPVSHHNASFFLLPRSRILARTGTPRDCNDLLPTMYRIHNAWFRLAPKPVEVLAPPVIQPLTQPKWRYVSPTSLATSGIYNSEDLDRLRSHIMFPVERPSMLNTIARGAMGESIPAGSISMSNLLDENSLNKIAESAGKKVWSGFVTFGSASAGVLAIFVIVRVTKLIIDTLIHGYALYSVYGWSMHIIGAIWSSVTNLLLHLGRKPGEKPKDQGDKEDTAAAEPLSASEDQHPEPMPRPPNESSGTIKYSYSDLRRYLGNNKNNETI